MSEINRRDINRCTCHCGGDMFYRHLHAASCPVSVDGDEAPISENAALRAEIERLTRERDEAVKRNNEDSAILALVRTALENLKHADGCYCEASFSPIGCHPRHSAECQQAQQALRGAGEEPGA